MAIIRRSGGILRARQSVTEAGVYDEATFAKFISLLHYVGGGYLSEPVELSVVDRRESAEEAEHKVDDYERLLGDAMMGDSTLFARQDTVEAAWAAVDPVLQELSPLYFYEPGTWGPKEADALVADVGGWNTPSISTPL